MNDKTINTIRHIFSHILPHTDCHTHIFPYILRYAHLPASIEVMAVDSTAIKQNLVMSFEK